jgi:hypothetical protein
MEKSIVYFIFCCLNLIQIRLGRPWMPSRIRQNDADPTGTGSTSHYTAYTFLLFSSANCSYLTRPILICLIKIHGMCYKIFSYWNFFTFHDIIFVMIISVFWIHFGFSADPDPAF